MYNEYSGFSAKYQKLLSYLKEEVPTIYFHFEIKIKVLDYLVNQLIEDPDYGEGEHLIFSVGFKHLEEQVTIVNQLLEDKLDGDYKKLITINTELNYLLLISDLYNDIKVFDNFNNDLVNQLSGAVDSIYKHIEEIDPITLESKNNLDKIIDQVIFNLPDDYDTINNIFEKIARAHNIF